MNEDLFLTQHGDFPDSHVSLPEASLWQIRRGITVHTTVLLVRCIYIYRHIMIYTYFISYLLFIPTHMICTAFVILRTVIPVSTQKWCLGPLGDSPRSIHRDLLCCRSAKLKKARFFGEMFTSQRPSVKGRLNVNWRVPEKKRPLSICW